RTRQPSRSRPGSGRSDPRSRRIADGATPCDVRHDTADVGSGTSYSGGMRSLIACVLFAACGGKTPAPAPEPVPATPAPSPAPVANTAPLPAPVATKPTPAPADELKAYCTGELAAAKTSR